MHEIPEGMTEEIDAVSGEIQSKAAESSRRGPRVRPLIKAGAAARGETA
jgi:hypothetical protein